MKEYVKPMMTLYMKRRRLLTAPIIIAMISAPVLAVEPPKAFDGTLEPFSYCASVGTTDSPAGGTRPSPVPPALEPYLPAALGMPAGATVIAGSTFWRCMDKSVYVCAVGANLVCDRKADSAGTADDDRAGQLSSSWPNCIASMFQKPRRLVIRPSSLTR